LPLCIAALKMRHCNKNSQNPHKRDISPKLRG
jgi:hypothetical protein